MRDQLLPEAKKNSCYVIIHCFLLLPHLMSLFLCMLSCSYPKTALCVKHL